MSMNDYQGPKGPHLNCLTTLSRTGGQAKNETSIHPTGRHKELHKRRILSVDQENHLICMPARRDKGPLAKRSKELDRRRRYWGMLRDASGHKQPGSMQG